MDLNKIAAFIKVIETGSFTQAGRILRQPKSRLSRRIASLEKDLGTQLLYRTTRHSSPTEAGLALYERCRHLIYELESAATLVTENKKVIAGTLKVTVPEDLGASILGPMLVQFSKRHPQLKYELNLSNRVVDLVKESVDVAIRIGAMQDTSLKMRSIGHVGMILVCSPDYAEKISETAGVSILSQHKTLVFSPDNTDPVWRLCKQDEQPQELRLLPFCRSDHLKVLLDLALAGQGVALLPEFLCVDALKKQGLKRIFSEYASTPIPIQFVWPSHKEVSPKLRAFVEFGLKYLGKYFRPNG